jgi:UDPglucose 6-dehydrogenase
MKVGIIGVGNVGSAVRHGFIRMGHDISTYDIKLPETSLRDVLYTDAVFICVPTPPCTDGACDVSIVEKAVVELADARYTGLVTIKSTVEPGTTDRLSKKYPHLRFAFCPEFLRERAMYIDFVENHDVCVVGTYTDNDAHMLRDIHSSLPKQFAFVTPTEAELAKYFINVFNALRIVYANQFYDVCRVVGADYKKVKDAVIKHRNVQDVYLDCNENVRGFSGACLPKDTHAFSNYARRVVGNDLGLSIFDGIVEINQRYKPTEW